MDKNLSKLTSTPLTVKPEMGMNPEIKSGRASDAYKKNFWNKIRIWLHLAK